jgi:hypothetical protein
MWSPYRHKSRRPQARTSPSTPFRHRSRRLQALMFQSHFILNREPFAF